MITIRQQIVSAIVNRLKTITTDNGYSSNAGNAVYSWFPENQATDPTMMPLLLVDDRAETLSEPTAGQVQHNLAITIEGHLAGGVGMNVSLRALIGDIALAVMGPQDRTLGGVCDTMNLTDGGTIQLEQDSETVFGAVTVTLEAVYRTDRGNWSVKI